MSDPHAALLEFVEEFNNYRNKDLSEADTRSKILDFFLIDVLGWNEKDITREGYVGSGYFDYLIEVPGFKFVVEAKRQLVDFKLPIVGRVHSLNMLYAGNADVIDQVRMYAFKKDVAFGVISNGHQFIIAKFINTDGADWKKNKAVVFRSLDDIRKNFIEIHNVLSKDSVVEKGGLFAEDEIPTPQIILTSLSRRDDKLVRNEFSAAMIDVIDRAFKDLSIDEKVKDRSILEYCYVKNKDIDKYNSELSVIFEDNPPKFDGRIAKVRNTDNTHEQLAYALSRSEPIVLIGSKGCGKTTFIRYFFDVALASNLGSVVKYVYVDFKGYTSQLVKDTNRISKQILEAIENTYKEEKLEAFDVLKLIYGQSIEKMKLGTWSIYATDTEKLNIKTAEFIEAKQKDSFDHLKNVVRYIFERTGHRPCIVLDNADQLNEEAQREIYIYAQSLNKGLSAVLLLSLREGYFYRWRNKPPFDAFTSTVYHISAPPYREVLRKRFEYLIEQKNFPSVEGRYSNAAKIALSGDSVRHLFNNLSDTIFGDPNSQVLAFLEETSYPNIRSGLEKLNGFLVSGHTKVLQYAVSKRYTIPIWEFFKAVALDADYYYHHEYSIIPNLFFPSAPSTSHFLKIRILLSVLGKVGDKISKHLYMNVTELVDAYVKAGYRKDFVLSELVSLMKIGLIESDKYSSDVDEIPKVEIEDQIKVTYPGRYYVTEAIGRFHYLDLVLQDVPIFESTSYDSIRAVFPESDSYGNRLIEDRRKAAEEFVKYLELQEKSEILSKKVNDPGLDANIVRDFIRPRLDADFSRLDRRPVIA